MDAWIDVANSGESLQSWLQPGRLDPPLFTGQTRTLYLGAGTYTLHADAEVASGITLVFEFGAVIEGDVTLVVRGRIVAGEQTLFGVRSGLTVLMLGRQTPQVTPRWWGALGDGRRADGEALAAMANSLRGDGPSVVVFPPGVYLIDRTVSLPTGKRYLGKGPPGAVVLRRHGGSTANGPLVMCLSSVAGRITFKDLTFDGDGGLGPLVLCRPATELLSSEVTVTGCTFMGSGATALEVWWGQGLWLSDCRFERCDVAIHARRLGGHIAVHGVTATDLGGEVVLEGGVGAAASLAESRFDGRIQIRSQDARSWDVRIADTTCDGLGVDAEGCRVGMIGCRLRGMSSADDTVVIEAARQVILEGCQLGLVVAARKSNRVGVRVRWQQQSVGAVLIHNCALSGTASTGLASATAFEISDHSATGHRRLDVVASSVDGGFGLAASLVGAWASFRELEVQCAGAFRLAQDGRGAGSTLFVSGLRYMPVGAIASAIYLEVLTSSTAGRPHRVRHEDVIVDHVFNRLQADPATLRGITLEGERLIRGPVEVEDARPGDLPGLVGDVFRPHDLLRATGWSTEWRCVRSGAQGEARWQPVCRQPPI